MRADVFDCLDGVGGRRPPQLAVIYNELRFTCSGRLQHRQSRLWAGNRRTSFLRRDARWHEDHLVQAEDFECFASENEMTVMNRIKRSAIDSNFFQRERR